MMAVSREDIIHILCSNYTLQPSQIEIDEGPDGRPKITIDGITKTQQIEIDDLLEQLIPFGIRLDVYRKSGDPININRIPIWDVGDK